MFGKNISQARDREPHPNNHDSQRNLVSNEMREQTTS